MANSNYWLGGTVDHTTEWEQTGNWSLGALPETGTDDVIFDGRGSGGVIYDCALPGTDAKILASLTVLPSYTGNIGSVIADEHYYPLQLDDCPTIYIAGTGVYRIMVGAEATYEDSGFDADSEIPITLINSPGTVYLMSQCNNGVNMAGFAKVTIVRGTVYIIGDSEIWDSAGTPDGKPPCETGTAIDELIVSQNISTTVIVGDKCEVFNGTTLTNIKMFAGVLSVHSALGNIEQTGGTLNYGSAAYAGFMSAGDDEIDSLDLFGGTFNWQPQSADGVISNAPVITAAAIYGGNFNATNMDDTVGADPVITALKQYYGVADLRNIFANFDITSFYHYGGTYYTSPGQELSLEGGAA